MTGWPAVAVTTGLMTLAILGLNVRLYRRMRATLGENSAHSEQSQRGS